VATKRFQRGGLDQGIAEFLGLKGHYSATIEDEIRPTIQMADLSTSPYAADYFPVGRSANIAALALNYPYLVIKPGNSVTLQVERIRVQSNSAAVIRAQLVLLTLTDIAVLLAAGVNNGTFTVLGRTIGQQPQTAAIVPERSSVIQSIHSTVLNISKVLDVVDMPAQGNAVFELPPPGVILTDDGTPGQDPGALAIVSSTIGLSIYAGFAGREWPIPG